MKQYAKAYELCRGKCHRGNEERKMNNFEEDVKIPKEYLNVSNFAIYDTINKRHGIITGIRLRFSFLTGCYPEFESYFDQINNIGIVYREDFITGKIKFVMVTGYKSLMLTLEEQKDLGNKRLDAIKAFLGEKYRDDCILRISQDKRDAELKEQEYREKSKIGKEIRWAESATKAFIFDNYSAMRVFELYKNETITENQFLIELINILANEKRVKFDMDALKDAHVFEEKMKTFIKDNEELVSRMIKNANAENTGEKEENDNAEN